MLLEMESLSDGLGRFVVGESKSYGSSLLLSKLGRFKRLEGRLIGVPILFDVFTSEGDVNDVDCVLRPGSADVS